MSEQNGKTGSSRDEMLEQVHTAGGLSISPQLFEALYLSPKNNVHGHLRQTFGNPTPIALGGFLLSTTPLSMALLEWQGAGGFGGAANVGGYFFLGGLLLFAGGLGEWLLGNTFPAVVFTTFAGFWLTFGATIVPSYGAYGSYSTTGTVADGLTEPAFFATFAFFLVSMTILCFIFTIASIRTNLVFFIILLTLTATFGCLAASFFSVAHGRSDALTLQHAGGALLLVASLFGWYIFIALLLLAVDFPIVLPLVDLTTVVKGKSARDPSKDV